MTFSEIFMVICVIFMVLQSVMNMLFIKLTHTLWLEIQDIQDYLSADNDTNNV